MNANARNLETPMHCDLQNSIFVSLTICSNKFFNSAYYKSNKLVGFWPKLFGVLIINNFTWNFLILTLFNIQGIHFIENDTINTITHYNMYPEVKSKIEKKEKLSTAFFFFSKLKECSWGKLHRQAKVCTIGWDYFYITYSTLY